MKTDTPTLSQDKQLLNLFVQHLIAKLGEAEVPSATLEVIRKLLQDNAVTFAAIRKGDFGAVAQEAEESFPFDDQGRPKADVIMLGRKTS